LQIISPTIKQLRIPIPNNPLGFTNVYLVGSAENYVLIDAGFDSDAAFETLQKELAEADVSPRYIRDIVITHGHGDHIGLGGRIRELSGARLSIHRMEARQPAPLNHERADPAIENAEWERSSGLPRESDARTGHRWNGPARPGHGAVIPDRMLEDGDHVRSLGIDMRVLWTPGHSPGLICLYAASEKVLFSADHVLPVTTPNIGLRPGTNHGDNNPLGDYLRSLEKIKSLDVELTLPGHEQPFNDLRKRVGDILQHHEHRNEEILLALSTGPKTAYQLSEAITWLPSSGGTRFHDLPRWDQRMAVAETLAHLRALVADLRIERFEKQGVVYYQLKVQA
jgi:glyoxylase-like metal-dependent hydrolase (beta-lactamase superfamily II)